MTLEVHKSPPAATFMIGYTGRVLRDIRRQLRDVPEGVFRNRLTEMLALVSRLLHQELRGSDKLYALHEAAVDCISKGKARVRYEFACKVSLATTLDRGFVEGVRSLPGNPYDGHTLDEALEQVTILTGTAPKLAVVDRGYRGHGITGTRVLIAGTRRGLTPSMARLLRRRSAIEPEIGHMKTDGRLARCTLKGTLGDTPGRSLTAHCRHLRYVSASPVQHHSMNRKPPYVPGAA